MKFFAYGELIAIIISMSALYRKLESDMDYLYLTKELL